MKFGKEFVAQMVPEWHDAYMDYNFLKLMLKDFMRFKARKKPVFPAPNPTAGGEGFKKAITFRAFSGLMRRDSTRTRSSPHSPLHEEEVILVKDKEQDGKDNYETMFLMSAKEGTEYEVVFFKRLDEELNKVNTFYRSKVEELLSEAAVLDKQMSSLVAFRAIASNKPGVDFKTSDVDGAATNPIPPTLGRYSGPVKMEVIKEVETEADGSIQSESRHRTAAREEMAEIEMTGSGFETRTVETASAPAPAPAPYARLKHKLRSNNRPHPIEIVKDVKIRITPDTPRSTIRSILTNPDHKTLSRRDLSRGNHMVRNAFIEFYQKLSLVKNYSSLNLMAFSKIMKKYDKYADHKVTRLEKERAHRVKKGDSTIWNLATTTPKSMDSARINPFGS